MNMCGCISVALAKFVITYDFLGILCISDFFFYMWFHVKWNSYSTKRKSFSNIHTNTHTRTHTLPISLTHSLSHFLTHTYIETRFYIHTYKTFTYSLSKIQIGRLLRSPVLCRSIVSSHHCEFRFAAMCILYTARLKSST